MFVFMTSLLAAPTLSAMESSLDRVAAIRAETSGAAAAGDEFDILAAFTARTRRELNVGQLLDRAIEEPDPGGSSTNAERVRGYVTGQFANLDALATEVRIRIDKVRERLEAADVSRKMDLEYRLRDYDNLLAKLLGENVRNAERAATLGLNSDDAATALDEHLRKRAARLADDIESTQLRLASASEQLASAGEARQATLEQDVAILGERRRRLKTSLGDTIELLQARGLDATDYVQTLFRTTGVISGDLLDTRVLAGLADEWMTRVRTAVFERGPGWVFRLIVFLAIIVASRVLGKFAARVMRRALARAAMPLSNLMQAFFVKLTANLVFLFGILIALSQIGVSLGPVLAGFGIAGFIVGFALQDTLSNFASGMMILFYRPYDIDDTIEAAGVNGKVKKMNLVSTTIVTFDNQKLVVPNNKIWGDVIRNVNAESNRRVDLTFGISYADDVAAAEAVLSAIIDAHELVLGDPAPTIKLHTLGESSVDFIVRPWVRAADYWTVYWDVTRSVKEEFDAAGISIPFPQRDVHVIGQIPA